MLILISNFFLCAVFAIVIYSIPISIRKKNIIFITVTYIQLSLIHGLVDPDAMNDLPGYCELYSRIANYGFFSLTDDYRLDADGVEFGFRLWNWFLSIFSNNVHFFLLVTSMLLIFCYYKAFWNYSPYLWFSILLFLVISYNQSIFVIRQHLSVAILLFSYPYIIKRDFIRFLGVFILSYLFHKSSLVFLPVYFLYGIRNNIIYITVILFAILFSVIAIYPIIQEYGHLFTRNDFFIENAESNIAMKAIIMGGIMISYIVFVGKNVLKPGINKLVFTISIIGITGNAIAGEAGGGRIFWSYFIVMLLQIPITMSYIKGWLIKGVFSVSVLTAFFLWAYLLAGDVMFWLDFRLII